jgi:glycosyltransferase involved in cell wall biosynthesis
MKKGKIFIQIASYRDPQLIPTLKDCIAKAKKPENLVFCICWQHDEKESLDEYKDDPRFKIIDVPYQDSKGACWARNSIQQYYDGEEYTLQLDSHHRFVEHWDDKLIKMLKQLKKKGHKKPLLTGYIPSFDPENDPKDRVNVPWKMNFDRFIPEGAVFFLPASIDDFKERTEPIPARFYSAHFCFTLGKFCIEVPHDPNYYFHGEEISIAARAYTWGYDLFHTHTIIAWHEYTRKGRVKQWDDDKDWCKRNDECHSRNRKLFEMDGLKNDIDFGVYGFGKIRNLQEYEAYSGLRFKDRSVQRYTLDNHLAPNPKISDPEEYDKSFLKIFKHCIDVGYDRVPEKDYDFWAVAFHAENGDTIFRKDSSKEDIQNYFNDPDKYCKIFMECQTDIKPDHWVVWPHSESKGWCERLTGKI